MRVIIPIWVPWYEIKPFKCTCNVINIYYIVSDLLAGYRNCPQGFQICHSLRGGTRAGMGTLMISKICATWGVPVSLSDLLVAGRYSDLPVSGRYSDSLSSSSHLGHHLCLWSHFSLPGLSEFFLLEDFLFSLDLHHLSKICNNNCMGAAILFVFLSILAIMLFHMASNPIPLSSLVLSLLLTGFPPLTSCGSQQHCVHLDSIMRTYCVSKNETLEGINWCFVIPWLWMSLPCPTGA